MTHFPGWEERQITVPEGFEFDLEKLRQVEGIIYSTTTTTTTTTNRDEANQRQLEAWLEGARGQEGINQ